jgi:hypothetical protein
MNRRILFTLLTVLALPLAVSVLRSQESRTSGSQTVHPPETDAQQIAHSKLYSEYKGIGDLRSVANRSSGDVEIMSGVSQKIFPPGTPPIQMPDFVANISKQADLIVIGEVTDQKSSLTAEGTFVFTDYSLTVEQILKDNPSAALRPMGNIIVTRPGGAVQFSGRTIKATDESVAPLEMGKRYLLFLDYIPATKAYKAFRSGSAFRIEGGKSVKLTKEHLPIDLENGVDLYVLMSLVQAALH